MSIAGEIREVADQFARNLHSRLVVLDQEETKIDVRKAQIEAERKLIRSAPKRAFDFQPQIGSDFQCPHCWVLHEKRSMLSPIRGNSREDFWICYSCNFRMSTAAL